MPIYKTVTIDQGYWAYRTVTKYRTERYQTSERYKTKKYYWYRRNGRLVRGSYDVWNTRTVVKTRQVPYTERQKYWVPKIVTEKRLDYYREVEHRDPVYGWREEKQGTRIEEHTKTTRAWAPVGTEVKWELKKDPAPTPTPYNPEPMNTRDPVLEPVPNFIEDPRGWAWTNMLNAGRQNDQIKDVLVGTSDALNTFNNSIGEVVRENTSPAEAAIFSATLATPWPGDEEFATAYIAAKTTLKVLQLGLAATAVYFAGKNMPLPGSRAPNETLLPVPELLPREMPGSIPPPPWNNDPNKQPEDIPPEEIKNLSLKGKIAWITFSMVSVVTAVFTGGKEPGDPDYPLATPLPEPTPTNTPIPSPTPTNTPIPSPTPTNTPIPSPTLTLIPTTTVSPTQTSSPTPTNSPIPTYTVVPTATLDNSVYGEEFPE